MTTFITASARRHGITAEAILHALNHPTVERPLPAEDPHRPDERLLVIGPDLSGQLLELVVIPADTYQRVIHAMRLRPSTQADFL